MLAGQVLLLRVPVPGHGLGKEKFLLCIDAEKGWFFTINTDPPRYPPAGVLLVARANRFLQYDSYVNTSQPIAISPVEVVAQLDREPTRTKGMLGQQARDAIKDCAKQHGVLGPAYLKAVLDNL